MSAPKTTILDDHDGGGTAPYLGNTDIERAVFHRYWALFASVPLFSLVFGGIAIASLEHRPITRWDEYFAVTVALGLVIGNLLGYGGARNMVLLFVPSSISISGTAVIGDFRRRRWTGPSTREIRFEDLRMVRHDPLIWLASVENSAPGSRRKPFADRFRWFLTNQNIRVVEAAYRAWEQRRRSAP